jgi:D-3-phosphoglycerate dehydrogenase
MDIKFFILINNAILMRQLQELGFENHEDFTSSKRNRGKNTIIPGIVIQVVSKSTKYFWIKATNLVYCPCRRRP